MGREPCRASWRKASFENSQFGLGIGSNDAKTHRHGLDPMMTLGWGAARWVPRHRGHGLTLPFGSDFTGALQ